MDNEIRFRSVIVGLGGITRTMLPRMRSQPWFDPVGLVDIRPEALTEVGNMLGLGEEHRFTDLHKALAELGPDLAVINTPSRLHFVQAKAALEAGAHVLIAKPVTNSFEDAAELVRTAKVYDRKLAVGQQIRYNRHYQAVKRFNQSERLGSVESVNFLNAKHRPRMRECTMAQPCLYEMSCHHFDSLMDAFPNHVPEWIFCGGFQPSWSPYNGPCMVNAYIVFEHPVLPSLHVNYHGGFSSQSHNYEYRLEGSRGVLRCRGFHMSNDSMSYEFAERGKNLEPIVADEGIEALNPFEPFFEAWFDYMCGGEEPPFSGQNNLKIFALLCACEESLNVKSPVKVAGNPRYADAFGTRGELGRRTG